MVRPHCGLQGLGGGAGEVSLCGPDPLSLGAHGQGWGPSGGQRGQRVVSAWARGRLAPVSVERDG